MVFVVMTVLRIPKSESSHIGDHHAERHYVPMGNITFTKEREK